jgi:hypothetical protein
VPWLDGIGGGMNRVEDSDVLEVDLGVESGSVRISIMIVVMGSSMFVTAAFIVIVLIAHRQSTVGKTSGY